MTATKNPAAASLNRHESAPMLANKRARVHHRRGLAFYSSFFSSQAKKKCRL